MDNTERFHQTNQVFSIPPRKRKRGRPPRSDEVKTHPPVTTTTATDENLIGRMVSGVVEGSFEAGYFLNVKVADTDKHFKGIVFLPDKVTPVTRATDLFPQAKMYPREVPSLNQHTPTTQSKNQTGIHPMSDEVGGSEAIDETNLPMDTEMKHVGGSSSAEDKLTEPESQTLSLMPQFASDDALKEDRSEACGATTETSRKQVTGCSSTTLSLELFQNETKRSGTADGESPKDAETRGMERKPISPVDDVPEELQLELGNTKMSATATAAGGFLANLFVNREEKAKRSSRN